MLAVWLPILQKGAELKVTVRPQVSWVYTSNLRPGIKREQRRQFRVPASCLVW